MLFLRSPATAAAVVSAWTCVVLQCSATSANSRLASAGVDPVAPRQVGPGGGQEPFGIDLLHELLGPLAPVGVSIPRLPGDGPVLAELPPWVAGGHGSSPSACAARRATLASGCVSHPG